MKYALGIVGLILVAIAVVIAMAWPSVGARPSDVELTTFQISAQFDKTKSEFINRRPAVMEEISKRIKVSDYFDALVADDKDRSPPRQLPEGRPDLIAFAAPSEHIKVVWFGHSSLLVRIGGKTLLIDPALSANASPFSFAAKRFQPPALALAELPAIDFVVVSHNHYDHLDMKTVQSLRDKPTRFVVPLGIGAQLVGWGIDKERIVELDWWRDYASEGIEFIATPAQHSSGRDRIHFNETLWSSWVVRSGKQSFFFSGDTGYDTHFKAIAGRYGPFDVAFMENGQYNEKWREAHLLPEETIQAFVDLNAKRLFPVHWGMFTLAPHTWYEPIVKTSAIAKEKGISLVTPQLGELVELDDRYENKLWWETVVN